MQAITPCGTARQAVPLAPGQARPRQQQQQQQGVTASLARRSGVQQQRAARNVTAQRRLTARASRRQAAAVVAKAGGDVLVVGSSGQTAARVVVDLLKAGYKVTAGVDTDLEESQEVLRWAKGLEIVTSGEAASLKLAEFSPLDAESIAGVLKRGSRVVLVVGDQAGSRKPDLRIYDAVVAALLENASRISQLVVVAPLSGGAGTGFFGGGRGGGASGRLSSVEQTVVDSGCPYLLVRAAPSDRVTDRYGEQANTVVARFGGLPKGLQASRSQVAAAVVAAMSQANGDAIIEVGASPDAEYADVASLVAGALTAGDQDAAAEEEEEEEEMPATLAKKAAGFFTLSSKKQPAPAVVEEEAEEEEEEEAAPAPAKKGFFGGFGTRKIVRQPEAAAVEEEEEEEEEAPEPAKPARRGGFSFGTMRMSKPQAAAVEEEEVEEEAAPAPAKRGGGGSGFRFGSRKEQPAVEEAEEEEEAPAPPRRQPIVRGRNPRPAEVKEAPAAVAQVQAKAAEAAAPAAEKKKGGFLGFLGIQQETVYVDE